MNNTYHHHHHHQDHRIIIIIIIRIIIIIIIIITIAGNNINIIYTQPLRSLIDYRSLVITITGRLSLPITIRLVIDRYRYASRITPSGHYHVIDQQVISRSYRYRRSHRLRAEG